MTLLVADSFDRANGAIGSTDGSGALDPLAWAVQDGVSSWTIVGNQAFTNAVGATNNIVTVPVAADVDVSVTLVDGNGGVVVRASDADNFITLCANSGVGSDLTLAAIIANVGTTIHFFSGNLVNAGDTLRLVAVGDSFSVYKNGVLLGTYTSAFNDTAIGTGMYDQIASSHLDNFSVTTPAPFPAISELIPNSGGTVSATPVSIYGTGFTGATAVAWDGTNIPFSVDDDGHITVVAPSHAAGVIDVQVTSANGLKTPIGISDQFSYTTPGAPTVTLISPHQGITDGGYPITVRGTGFAGTTNVAFHYPNGSVTIASYVVNDDTSLTVTAPAAPFDGPAHIVVTAGLLGGSNLTPNDVFTFFGRGAAVVTTGHRWRPVLEVAFGSAPTDEVQNFLDYSPYLRDDGGLKMKRGRQEDAQVFNAGTLDVQLDNRDLLFDSFSNPDVKPEKMVRYSLEYPWFGTNIVSPPNGLFQDGVIGDAAPNWTAVGDANGVKHDYDTFLTNRDSGAHRGFCGFVNNTGGGFLSDAFPISPSTPYAGSARANSGYVGPRIYQVIVTEYDSGMGFLTSHTYTAQGGSSPTFYTRVGIGSFTTNAAAAFCTVQVGITTSDLSEVLFVAAVILDKVSFQGVIPQWTGYADEWKRDWQIGDSVVALKATDGFKALGYPTLNSKLYHDYINSLSPTHYYRLSEAGANRQITNFKDGITNEIGAVSTIDAGVGPLYNVAGAPITEVDGAFSTVGPSTADRGHISLPYSCAVKGTESFLLAVWYRNPGTPETYTPIFMQGWPFASATYMGLYIHKNGNVYYYFSDGTDGLSAGYKAWDARAQAHPMIGDPEGPGWHLHDALPHLIALYYDASSTETHLIIDGIEATTFDAGTGTPPTLAPQRMQLGAFPAGIAYPTAVAEFDEFAEWFGAAAPADAATAVSWMSAAYNLARNLYPAELSGVRINRLLDLSAWPVSLRSIDPGSSVIDKVGAPFVRANPLQELQKVEATEQGWLFMDPVGNVRWKERRSQYDATSRTSIFGPFGSDSGSGEVPYEKADPADDDRLLINHAEYAMQNGGQVQIVDDMPSQADFWIRSDQRSDLQLTSNGEVIGAAQWVIDHLKGATTRIVKLTLNPMASDALAHFCAYAEIGQHLSIALRPPGVSFGSPEIFEAVILGIGHTHTRGKWKVEWDVSSAWVKRYFLMGDIFNSYPMGW